jgi:hypothetical protein
VETLKTAFLTAISRLPLYLALLELLSAAFVLFTSSTRAQSVDLTEIIQPLLLGI